VIACSLVMNFLFPLAYVRQTKLSVCEIISLSGGVSVWCGGVQLAATTRDGLMNNSSRNWTPLKTTWRDWDRRLITETDRRLINKTDRQLITETGDWSLRQTGDWSQRQAIDQMAREYEAAKDVDVFRRYGMLKRIVKRTVMHLRLRQNSSDDQNTTTSASKTRTKDDLRKRTDHINSTSLRSSLCRLN